MLECGAPAPKSVTLIASFCPKKQWREYVDVKKCSPAEVKVILAGLLLITLMGLLLSQLPYADLVTSATS